MCCVARHFPTERRPAAATVPRVLPATFHYRSESEDPAPTRLTEVGDALTADSALRQVRAGIFLLYTGDFHNAKQLLAAMARRLPATHVPSATPAEQFRAERRARALEHETLSRLLVALDERWVLQLARAPDVATLCREVWGAAEGTTVVALKTLLGMLGAAQWRTKGLAVPGLKGTLTPHYGVYSPTRSDYVELLAREVKDAKGKRVLDVGTGTGVLALLLLQRGASYAVATDCDARAIACARANAKALRLAEKFEALEADLFPPGEARFDLIVSNPPWIPEPPKNRIDRAVFDDDGRFVHGLLQGAPARLAPGGQLMLLLSDLAVLLGLRSEAWLDEQLAAAGLEVRWKRAAPAKHGRAKDRSDPLHQARSRETTSLYCLAVAERA
jgi:methylase of polypeptide subunit release factors